MSGEFKALGSYAGPNITTPSLVLHLDAGNTKSYPGSGTAWYDLSGNNNHFTLYNGPTFSNGAIIFDGVNDYAASNSAINLSNASYITSEIWFRCNNAVASMAIEHSANWNATSGGWGLAPNADGNTTLANMNHTNHNGGSSGRNYTFSMGTVWNSHVNIFSTASDATGRLTYVNGQLQAFTSTGGYGTGTTTSSGSVFPNATLYLASRGGASSFLNGAISVVKVYSIKQTAAEVLQNYSATSARYFSQLMPNQISGLSLWLDASDPETIYQDSSGTTLALTDNSPVGMWKDRSGNARHATQVSSLSSRPTFKTNVRNNRPAVYFDGSGTWLSNTAYSYSGASTLFIVASNSSDNGYYFDGATTSIVRGTYRFSSTTANMYAPSSVISSAASFNLSNISLIESYWNGASSQVGVNGQMNTAGSLPLYTLSGYTVGRTRNGSGAGVSTGNFCEILHYERILDEAERKQVESYLNAKWSIY
jgi:hypothetical protein